MLLFALVLLHQVLTPLQYLLYEGDVTWNEKGQRFSWRMKLRDKVGQQRFHSRVQYLTLSFTDLQARDVGSRSYE